MHVWQRPRDFSAPLVALIAAAVLHGIVWWAWSHDGVGGSRGDEPVLPSLVGQSLAEQPVQLLTRSVPAGQSTANVAEAPKSAANASGVALREPAPERSGAGALMATRYLDASELDQAARPVADWLLDEEALQALPHTLVQLRLKVSAEGRIDHVEVVRAEPPGEWVLAALRPLRHTPMQAGLRGGEAVASTLVVELATENERVR